MAAKGLGKTVQDDEKVDDLDQVDNVVYEDVEVDKGKQSLESGQVRMQDEKVKDDEEKFENIEDKVENVDGKVEFEAETTKNSDKIVKSAFVKVENVNNIPGNFEKVHETDKNVQENVETVSDNAVQDNAEQSYTSLGETFKDLTERMRGVMSDMKANEEGLPFIDDDEEELDKRDEDKWDSDIRAQKNFDKKTENNLNSDKRGQEKLGLDKVVPDKTDGDKWDSDIRAQENSVKKEADNLNSDKTGQNDQNTLDLDKRGQDILDLDKTAEENLDRAILAATGLSQQDTVARIQLGEEGKETTDLGLNSVVVEDKQGKVEVRREFADV